MKKTIEWHLTDEKTPPYGVVLLCWHECTGCKEKKKHYHQPVAEPWPNHGIYIGRFIKKDLEAYELYCKLGYKDNPSIKKYLEDYWTPKRPKYWAIAPDPY